MNSWNAIASEEFFAWNSLHMKVFFILHLHPLIAGKGINSDLFVFLLIKINRIFSLHSLGARRHKRTHLDK